MKQQIHNIFSYLDNTLHAAKVHVVQEFPLQLIVNGREIATLIGSPHELRFLVAGFLRLQNFVQNLSDFEMFSVCEDFGTANMRIKGELPERLKPVLTSGCGTGVTFSMPDTIKSDSLLETASKSRPIPPNEIFSLMNHLSNRADQYKSHGGIHSAAVGRNGDLLLYAEDLGRHNTLDRIAGEALFKSIDLSGTLLVTSGRVSSEMVAKAALLGVRLIASRTSPTDMAIKLCDQSNICLVGYVRGGKFTVYSHPELIEPFSDSSKLQNITAAILAGGASSRMGTNKALLKVNGVPIITRSYQILARLFDEVLIVTNNPEDYDFLPCRKVPDIFPGIGSIAGLHSALVHSASELTFVTACDMPFVEPEIIRYLCELQMSESGGFDAIIPFSAGGQEPLHAVYAAKCKDIFERAIQDNERKILDILARLNTRLVTWDTMKLVSGSTRSFLNVNTREELDAIIEEQHSVCELEAQKKTC